MKIPSALRALKHRNYRLFFGGQLISLIGTWMDSVAASWLVYRLTGSSVLLGTVGFANQIPVFLLATLGGAAADRWNRRSILVGTQAASMILAGILAALTLGGVVQVWHVIGIATLLGVVNAFDIPARQAFVVDMVGREDLMNAIALNSSLFNGARMIGPAVAGVLVAAIGEGWCFFANSVSYIAVITGLLMMRVAVRPRAVPGVAGHAVQGFRFVVQNPPVRALILLLGIVSLTGMPYAVLMPIFADQILHSGSQGMGVLMGCSGIGALAGALALAAKKGIAGLGRWVAYGAAGFGVSLILFGMSRHFFASSVALVAVGFCSILQMATSNTLVQSMAPDELRGRIMAVYSMMFMGMAPIGAFGAGVAASAFGAPLTIVIGGLICFAAAGVFGWRLRFLRAQARELILAQQTEGGVPSQEITGDRAA